MELANIVKKRSNEKAIRSFVCDDDLGNGFGRLPDCNFHRDHSAHTRGFHTGSSHGSSSPGHHRSSNDSSNDPGYNGGNNGSPNDSGNHRSNGCFAFGHCAGWFMG
jgi:hypothetical protein